MKSVFVVSFIILTAGAFGRTEQAAPAATPASLGDFYRPGPVFLDTNDDGAIDAVDARIVLPEHPSATELATASDIAARLGFETSAMDLPLEKDRGSRAAAPRAHQGAAARPSIFVGAGSLSAASTTAAALGAASLKAGEGFVAAFTAAGKPALAVLGGDAAGLTAAGVMAAGHLPLVWDQKGPTVDAVAADVKAYLDAHGVTMSAGTVPAVFVQANEVGIERLVVDAQMASAGDVVKAQVALNQLKAVGAADAKRALSYGGVHVLHVRVRGGGSAVTVDLPRARSAETASAAAPGRRPGGGAKENFDLSSFYSNDGALGDSDNNLIPDRLDVVLSADGDGTDGVIDLAARLGLESTGIQVPIAKTPAAVGAPESEPILVLIGVSHPLIDRLVANKKWEKPSLEAGEGLIQLVPKAFGEKSALIVTGGDAAGVRRAVTQLAERFPHIWARGKDRTTLDDVEEEARKFLAGRSPAGQAAMSLYKLDKLAAELQGKDLSSAHVRVFVDKAADGLANVVKEDAAAKIKAASLTVDVQTMDVQKGKSLINEEFDIPSEVDEFWTKVRNQVVPAVKKARHPVVVVEARLSEPPEVRQNIEQQARAELLRAGADEKTRVTVLSAYKQGYSWLYDVVRPALAGKPVDRITIRFGEIGPAPGWKQEGMYVPTRWLLEIYPIDEILSQELKIDRSRIAFERRPLGSPAYEVVATAANGSPLFRQTFEPKVVERAFFDRFPEYERVRVTTGWIRADVGSRTVADERIETDPERFWDHFQGRTLPALYDHVMTLGKGKPRAEDAPFFGELTVDLSMSEPDYRLPVDQEQISSMEALHEEIYFNTLHFFDVMGRFTRGPNLNYPGRIIPIMHPRADGKPAHAKISLTGFDAPRPMVVIDYTERGGAKGEIHLDIPKIAVERPRTTAARVRATADGIERLDLRVKVDSAKDEREDLVKRRAEEQVDRQIISAEQVEAVVANLARLRAGGLYKDALAYRDLGALHITSTWEYESHPDTETVAVLEPNGAPAPWPDIKKYLGDHAAGRKPGEPLVQWEAPIPPPEAYAILARMSAFPEATVYKVGESYLGKEVWAMDLMPPVKASHWSQAKQTTLKPTIIYSARQHANEVSSTSHTLKLAEMLLTDDEYRAKLKKVNVVFHPITNADGAQLAYDLQKIDPTYMLHAGYLGALGVDVITNQFEQDPMYPESSIRPKLWRTWLPDIFLNPHGYPSHEWVQLFSEYAAWVRTRAVETRDYWTMRGWWMPGFAWLDDPRYPRHKAEQMKLLNMITEYAKAAPSTVALNQRAYDRYKRYSFDFDQKNFKLDFTNGVLIYKSIKGAHASPTAQDFMARNPNVTVWDGSTEAPDETARGEWMKIVATAGLQWDKANLEYLLQGHHEIERKVEPFWNGVSLSINRPRPPKPPKDEERKTTSQQ